MRNRYSIAIRFVAFVAALAVGTFALGLFYHDVSPQLRVAFGTVLFWSAIYGSTAFQVELTKQLFKTKTTAKKERQYDS
jgi:uncharacterized RDD family membrane protein YckC